MRGAAWLPGVAGGCGRPGCRRWVCVLCACECREGGLLRVVDGVERPTGQALQPGTAQHPWIRVGPRGAVGGDLYLEQ